MRLWGAHFRYDETGVIRPTETCPLVNFEKLKKCLIAVHDTKTQNELESMVDLKLPKFLDRTVPLNGFRAQLGSFPRSGNSFCRKMVEQITGIYTGSDWEIEGCLPLQHSGLLGERVFGDDSVWITKSHFPFKQMK